MPYDKDDHQRHNQVTHR